MVDQVANFKKVTVSTGYNNTATSIVLATGQGAELPDPSGDNYNVVWWDSTNYNDPADDPNVEIVRVTAKSSDTLTVTRNQESSGASNKNNADATYKMILATTAKIITDLIADVEKAATVIVGKSGHVDYLTTDYGSDDACIKAAVDYVSGLGGGSVLIREGTYTIETELASKSLVNIYGCGYKTILIQSGSTQYVIHGSNVNNFTISNLKIDMNATADHGIKFDTATCKYITISNVKIYNSPAAGTVHVGIGCGNATDIKIINCDFEALHDYAIVSQDSERILIEGCHVFDGIGVIACNTGSKDNIINGNIINTTEGTSIGIKLIVAENCIVSNNVLTSTTKTATTGISLGDTGCNNNTIIGNNVSGYLNGIYLNIHPYRTLVADNTVYDCTSGILQSGGDEYTSIMNNRIDTCTTGIDATLYYGSVVGNNISNVTNGIILHSNARYGVVSNNVLTDSVTTPITNNSGASTIQIVNNPGYNPVGAVGPPSVLATTVNYTNAYSYPCQVQVYGGTVTEIDIDDIATGLTSGVFIIPPGGTINITYSAAPSWRWWGL